MILVTGATGGLGKATIDKLVELVAPGEIKALVRDASKAENLVEQGINIAIGDYLDYDSLINAFQGVDTVILISAPVFSDRETQQRNAINAAVSAGVGHFILTGIQRKENSDWIIPMVTESDLDSEKLLKESGLSYTIVLNNIYSDVLSFLMGVNPAQTSVLEMPAGDGKVSFTTRADFGEGLAILALQDGHQNKTYTFTNSESLSFGEIAEIISELSGRTVPYVNVDREDYVSKLVAGGLPEPVADFLACWPDAIRVGEMEKTFPILTELLGHEPTSLRNYLKEEYFKG
jgi:NAD(P)H dehydrogenase (quinone)